jgi:hypothetical protein
MLKPISTFAQVALRDYTFKPRGIASPEDHLLEAEAWLCRAQDACADGGVSYGYSIRGGWRQPYPETSGYIVPTFLRLSGARDATYLSRAKRILTWLLTVQNSDGSFANTRYGAGGIVFDTGQVLFGLIRGYQVTADVKFLQSARKAAAWLTHVADADLRWTRNEHLGTPHVYNARTAWALLLMNQLEFDSSRAAVARSNLEWALSEQRQSGFFENCSFRPAQAPFTHTIAYTARGLLESGVLLNDERLVSAAARCADATLSQLRCDGYLPSAIHTDGKLASRSCCLTGNCQFALVWARLHALHGGSVYRKASMRALDYVMSAQDISTSNIDVRGGIKGSHPVWGRYAPMCFPNWATKFFVDAMWLRKGLTA